MKKIAIIMIALIALNSFAVRDCVEVRAAAKTTKTVQRSCKKKKAKKKINRKIVMKRLIAYGKRKGMTFDSKLTINTSSWFPPTSIKYYKNNSELLSAGKGDIRYLLESFSDCEPSDISFNVNLVGRYLYILYS